MAHVPTRNLCARVTVSRINITPSFVEQQARGLQPPGHSGVVPFVNKYPEKGTRCAIMQVAAFFAHRDDQKSA
ncbi:MAG: hypothetical protein M1827_007389 [Pycnora praestabilis]|nr:MAG: hypothetical protein M1827_007389 [Pycnora praestabilis]